ncbi:MAG TPA: ATP-dependent DNA helicase [Terriglobales bacterium]|nr:ATP-dependent DNA helicase [Terriglobales bacterium]
MNLPKSSLRASQLRPDERQQEAIEHLNGPMLVVAGAGTGKTTVLTRRIAYLIREQQVSPDQILALTYTENAAREMRQRVKREVGDRDISGLQLETFHAYCNNLLIRNGKGFEVIDDKDLWIYLRRRIRELKLNYFVRAAKVTQFLDDLLDFIRRCQDELVGPEKYQEYVRRLQCGELSIPRVTRSKDVASLTDDEVCERCQEIANVYTTVERMLRERNLGTFGHQITHAHDLLKSDPVLLKKEQQHARFILVDEFQDANFAQVKILDMLAGEDRNVFAVGDPDQAIYRFRGASSAAFELFQHHFPGSGIVILERNRRSTTAILECAFALINKNPEIRVSDGTGKPAYRRSPLRSAREEEAQGQGAPMPLVQVDVAILRDKEIEGSDLVQVIQARKKETKCSWSDFSVLYRQHHHREHLAADLAQAEIPFSIENMDVMDTPEARDLFACLGAVVAMDDSASLLRVAALPQFSINPEHLRAGLRSIPKHSENASLVSVLEKLEGGPPVLATIQQTRDQIANANAMSRQALDIIIRNFALPPSPPLDAVLDFVAKWEAKATTETRQIGELVEYLEYFREAHGSIPLPATDADAVRLMTAHSAKGLEFKHVFILRAYSPSFPNSYREPLVEFPRELRDPESLAPDDDKSLNAQEERRLFYVAMTRACDSLTFYAKQGTGKDRTPSGFLRELLKDPGMRPWLRQREAKPFQTSIFAAGSGLSSRTSEWLSLPPSTNLGRKLSASAVQSYQRCPLQFKLEREWRIPGEVPAALQYGATMHRVLRSYFDSVRSNRPMDEGALIAMFKANLADAHLQDRYQHELYERQGVEQLKDFLALSRRSPAPEVLHTEEGFEIKVGECTVVGRIDRIDRVKDGAVAITDYKTGKPQSQDDADDSLQLSIYALAAQQMWGYAVDRLVFYNLQENTSVITQRERSELEEARQTVETVAAKIADGRFEAKPGFYCAFCAYANICPAREKPIQVAPIVKIASTSRN